MVSLWVGTAIIGIGIAIINVLMPAVVKRDFPGHVAAVTAAYTALLAGLGAVSSGVVVPISQIPLDGDPAGWRFALLVTGAALLPFAIAGWWWAHRGAAHVHVRATAPRGRTGIWADPVAWLVAVYMGLQASMFYMFVTWLAPLSMSIGRTEVVAGIDVMVYQLFSLAGCLLLPLILRGGLERWAPALIPSLAIVGVAGLMIAPDAVLLWASLIGLTGGATLAMSLTLMAQRARDHDASTALSGMSQSVGYVIAALGPVAFGTLHSATGDWTASLALVLAVLAALTVVECSRVATATCSTAPDPAPVQVSRHAATPAAFPQFASPERSHRTRMPRPAPRRKPAVSAHGVAEEPVASLVGEGQRAQQRAQGLAVFGAQLTVDALLGGAGGLARGRDE